MARTGRQRLGDEAEALARRHLARNGLECLATNYRCRVGEIDLVMEDEGTLVFVEVRYRGAGARYDAITSVSNAKQRRIILATERFLSRYPKLAAREIRFDVVCIDRSASGEARLQWLRDAFRPA